MVQIDDLGIFVLILLLRGLGHQAAALEQRLLLFVVFAAAHAHFVLLQPLLQLLHAEQRIRKQVEYERDA
jgi:hypothetical protein